MLANLAGFGAATSLFPWEFSTGLCHCTSLLKGGWKQGLTLQEGRGPQTLQLHAKNKQKGQELPAQPQTMQQHDRNGPQERLQSWKGNSQRR